MNKRVIISIAIIVITSIFLINEIRVDEITYQDCFKRSMESLGTIICHNLSDYALSFMFYIVIIAVGIWLLIFGLRSKP